MASVKPKDDFDAEASAKALRAAMKGRKTDEATIIKEITSHSNEQRQEIKSQYKSMFGEDLEKRIKSETKGDFRDALLALTATPAQFDARELRSAMKGLRTDDTTLVEILIPRSNAMIEEIREAYEKEFRRNLEEDVQKETSGDFKRLLVSLVNAGRDENQEVDMDKAKADAAAIYEAGEGQRFSTDESTFNMILVTRSVPQLRMTFNRYYLNTGHEIEAALKKETKGSLRKGYLCIVQCVKDMPTFFAFRLKEAMSGLGSDDEGIIRVMVARSELDLAGVKPIYEQAYGKPLAEAIKKNSKGDYKRLLLALLGEQGG